MVRLIFGDSRWRSGVALGLALAGLLVAAPAAAAETYRERCHSRRALPSRIDAISACDEAVQHGANAQDMWAAASVRVSRPEAPTMDDLIRADLLAAAATRMAPGERWGYLARLEIARRWGDRALIARRLDELQRVAPTDPRTLRAAAELRPAPIWPVALGWSLLSALALLSLGHAVRRGFTQRARARTASATWIALVVAAMGLAAPRPAAAQRFPIDDADPLAGVPDQAAADALPMDFAYYLQDLSDRAEAATTRGDHAAAARYLTALARAVPDASLPQQKLCAAQQAAGDRVAAAASCRAALALPGVRAEDFVRFGALALAEAEPTAAALADVEAAARHLAAEPATRLAGQQLLCRLGVRRASVPLLEACTAALTTLAPDDPATFVFLWSLAMEKGQRAEAKQRVEQARAAGLGEDGLLRLRAAMAAPAAAGGSARSLLLVGLAALLAGLGVAVVARRRRRQWTTTISGSS